MASSVATSAARITRETFISPDHARIAAAQSTMWILSKDGQSTMEAPVPESVRETGIIPAGYSVDFILDPATVVKSLAEQGITTVDQLPEGQLDQLIAAINAEKNLSIIPTSVYEAKRALTEQTLSEAENAA
ncbi:hypothetical protein BDQ12DRAFT_726075 [Crucibulum laeve]|uniref:Uncharacterized protein n=1 Tax=Crucibulum laeve TaxID=68775 RepID=A0A5C3LTB3_9AGAR|nr:hypothetical protein BDQ12DRAFT_726075 [Crucibulum laeve]